MTSNNAILTTLKAAGYRPGQITSNTFVYINDQNRPAVMEKRDTQSYPADERGDFGAYVDSFMWDEELTLARIEQAGGRAAQTAHNIRQANAALAGRG